MTKNGGGGLFIPFSIFQNVVFPYAIMNLCNYLNVLLHLSFLKQYMYHSQHFLTVGRDNHSSRKWCDNGNLKCRLQHYHKSSFQIVICNEKITVLAKLNPHKSFSFYMCIFNFEITS